MRWRKAGSRCRGIYSSCPLEGLLRVQPLLCSYAASTRETFSMRRLVCLTMTPCHLKSFLCNTSLGSLRRRCCISEGKETERTDNERKEMYYTSVVTPTNDRTHSHCPPPACLPLLAGSIGRMLGCTHGRPQPSAYGHGVHVTPRIRRRKYCLFI